MAATIVAGFGFNFAMGRSTIAVPALVHVHAFVMVGWVALYVAQNALIASGQRRLHRTLGWLSLGWLPAVLIMGLSITRHSMQAMGGPPFFDANEFLIGNSIGVFVAVGLAAWGVAVRANTGWHRRLLFCSMAVLTGPAFGRLLPVPLLIPWGWWVCNLIPLVFPLVGMLADRRRYGTVHPAWLWGVGLAALLPILVADLVAYSGPGEEFTRWVLEGTPGAARPMEAYLPPM